MHSAFARAHSFQGIAVNFTLIISLLGHFNSLNLKLAIQMVRERQTQSDPHRALFVTVVVSGHTDHKVVSLGFLSVEDNRWGTWSRFMEPFVIS